MEQLVYRNEGKNRTKNVCVSPSVSVQSEPRDDRHHSYYVYDHTGERVVKLTGETSIIDCNAEVQETKALLDNATVYPSPYMVLNNKGYTKHYYAGAERVAARIGTGGLGYIAPCAINDYEAQSRASKLLESANRQIDEAASGNDEFLRTKIENIYGEPMDIGNFNPKELPVALKPYVKASPMELFRSVKYNSSDTTPSGASVAIEPEVFFYHSDHLGSASWITDGNGTPVQHLQYLPFGEPYVNQRASGYEYKERFTFTGKERDEETGYGYFGARYMDHELMTMWLSVDPLSDKYPSISPYAYCAWNPVKLVDPDGMQAVRPPIRYATYNRPQRYVQSNLQRTTYRPSGHTVTRYSRTGCPNIEHAPLPTYLRQQKWNGIITQYNELYGKRWAEPVAQLINHEMKVIGKKIENKQFSIVQTENRIYSDVGSYVSTSKYIQFDDPKVQEKFDQAQAAWTAAYNKIQKEHTITLPNGSVTLDYDGWQAVLEIGKSPVSRVLEQARKSKMKFKAVEQSARAIPTIQASNN